MFLFSLEVNDEIVLQEAWKQISSRGVRQPGSSFRPQERWQHKLPTKRGGGVLCFSQEGPRKNLLKIFPNFDNIE